MDKSVGCISGSRNAGSKIDTLKILIDIPKWPSPKVISMCLPRECKYLFPYILNNIKYPQSLPTR